MPRPNSILKNTTFLMSGNALERILSFCTAILITRYLGPEKYGQYIFVFTFVAIGAVLWDFGLNTLLTREISRDKDLTASYSGASIIIKTSIMLPVLGFSLLFLKLSGYASIILASVCIFAVARYLMSIFEIFQSLFSAYRRMEFTAILGILRAATLLMSVLYIIKVSAGGLVDIFFCYLTALSVTLIASIIFLKRYFVLPTFPISLTYFSNLIKEGFSLFLISAAYMLYFRIDHLMLSRLAGDIQTGLYGSAYTLFEVVLVFFPMIIMTSAFPVLSHCYKNNIDDMKKIYNVLLKYSIFLGIPISCGTFLLAKEIIITLYGNVYIDATPAMSILGLSISVFFITNLLSWTLTAADMQKHVLISYSIALLINVILNLWLIPLYGAQGAAITTLICVVLQLIYMSKIIKKVINVKADTSLIKSVIGAIVMCFTILLIKNDTLFSSTLLNIILIISVSAIVYFGIAIFLKTINLRDIELLLRD